MLVDDPDSERFAIDQTAGGSFDIKEIDQHPVLGPNACPSGLNDDIIELVEKYYAELEGALATAWLTGAPHTQYALSIDNLLTPFEHGTHDTELDHELITNITAFGTRPQVDGLFWIADTNAEVKAASAVIPAPETYVAPEPRHPLLLSDDGWSAHDFPVEFDVSLALSTGVLNQVLRERHATALVNFTAPAAAGQAFGAALADAVDPILLAPLTGAGVVWKMSPTVAAFTWMNPDPLLSPIPQVEPIIYHLYDLRLEAFDGTHKLLALRLDFLDPLFELVFSGELGATTLNPLVSTFAHFRATVAESDLPGCPMTPHDATGLGTCDRLIENSASTLLRGQMIALMEELLSDYPAPQFFDAAGTARTPEQILWVANYQSANRIIFYGTLPEN